MNNSAKTTPTGSREKALQPLFRAVLEYRSQAKQDAVVEEAGHDGVYIGSGDGIVNGDRLQGTMHWSLWSGNCLYPVVRKGQAVSTNLHLCTMAPSGFVETKDGARIRFDGRGYGLRIAGKYQVSLTLVFVTEDSRYSWLTHVLGVMEGEFNERTGVAIWDVFVPAQAVVATQP